MGGIVPWTSSPLSPSCPFCLQPATGWTDRQTKCLTPGEEHETQSPPSTMETKLQRKAVVWCRTSKPRGKVALEKWAAVTESNCPWERWGVRKRVCNVVEVPCVSSGPEASPSSPHGGCWRPNAQLWGWPPAPQGGSQRGQRSQLLSFVNGHNPVVGVVVEPSACGLHPAPPAPSHRCVQPRNAPQPVPKPGLCKPW